MHCLGKGKYKFRPFPQLSKENSHCGLSVSYSASIILGRLMLLLLSELFKDWSLHSAHSFSSVLRNRESLAISYFISKVVVPSRLMKLFFLIDYIFSGEYPHDFGYLHKEKDQKKNNLTFDSWGWEERSD